MPALTSLPCSTWSRTAADAVSSALAAAVFAFLDVADVLLCLVYGVLDGILEDSPVGCYCHRSYDSAAVAMEDEEVSDTLYVRRSAFRDALTGLLRRLVVRRRGAPEKSEPCKGRSPRWSDCGCASCGAWRGNDGGRLHFVVKEPAPKDAAGTQSGSDHEHSTDDAAIFIHGFTSSSSFWAETVFSMLSCRLFAVDLLGFGKSPKPANCMYRLKDHVEAIERSLVELLDLSSFHLVSHSMGCIIALALAARYPTRVKSITLVAPPYFLPCEQKASQVALSRLAEKKLWPPLLFGSAVMSWYEHIGRTVCFFVCKNHLVWEWLFKLLTRKRDVDFRVRDLTKHTHHSAWHTMHNVICGGAGLQDRNLEAVEAAGIPVQVIHGVKDQVVSVECSHHLKAKLPRAEVRLMGGCDHTTVVLGREKGFVEELRAFWSRSASRYDHGAQANGC
ncbi:probable lysophospholipase BODYGUARD 4 isoform X2 [Phragmites australis]|uniref:probable lysophospholipase BODYGUARD 4 isoform X2 n=1 Tax=Phragmites australis TaxID=29695 RepID=UPI002D76B7F4|nr:probable lysophospholipase BODYGUARD 4 isoform X2 [Phragmites australis]